MNVGEVMTKEVFSCMAADDLAKAAGLMWEHDCGCVPVVNSENVPIAMLTDRDACMAAYTQGMPLRAISVSSAASKSVWVVGARDSIDAAEELMKRNQVRRLPVVDRDGRLVGLISLNDIARQAGRPSSRGSNGVTAIGVTQTLAAICEPHRGANA